MHSVLTPSRYARLWLLSLLAVALAFFLCTLLGPGDAFRSRISLSAGWPENPAILHERLFRLACASLVGFALSAAGVALQALLRNPLADPYVLGISSGAGVGVMTWLLLTGPLYGIPAIATSSLALQLLSSGKTIPAVLGALATCSLVFFLARRRASSSSGGGAMEPTTLLLVGVVISAVNGAVLMLLNSIAPGGIRIDFMSYLMGAIGGGVDKPLLSLAALVILIGFLPVLYAARSLNVGSLSDVEAISLGVNIHKLRTLSFIGASILTAGAMVLAGPIGFVGLICPHICRALVGADHRKLLVVAPCAGAIFLMLADTLVRSFPIFNGELPVGVITALCGGPFFLLLLKRKGASA